MFLAWLVCRSGSAELSSLSEYSGQPVISRLEIFPAILFLCKQKGKAGVTPWCGFLGLYCSFLSSILSKLQRLREEGSGIHCRECLQVRCIPPGVCRFELGTCSPGICVQGWPNSSTLPSGRPGHTTGSAASLGIRRALRNGKAAPKSRARVPIPHFPSVKEP